jgi:hypothetical protein
MTRERITATNQRNRHREAIHEAHVATTALIEFFSRMETDLQQRGGGKKKKKQAAKKKKAEESLHAREVQQLEALDAELAQKEEVGSADIESKVTQSTSRNDDSEIDDDDVPSELLPVNWRNPALDVDTELEHPPDIAVPIPEEVASLKDSSQPEQSKELILENPEQYFEDPFSPAVESEDESLVHTPSGPEVSFSGSDARESLAPRRESLKYVSAWGHMASVTNSDDEFEPTEPPVAAATGGEEAAVVSQALSRSEILEEVALEQWVKETLKGSVSSCLLHPLSSHPSLQTFRPSWTRHWLPSRSRRSHQWPLL